MIEKNIILAIEEAFIAAFACVIDQNKAVYASTPITNGPIVLEHIAANPSLLTLSENEYWGYVKKEIIPVNKEMAKAFVTRIRATKVLVIDPSCYYSDLLSQKNYLSLWGRVIESFAKEVWFNEGWSYSKGCVAEYIIAIENGLPTLDTEGNPLNIEQALSEISYAIEEGEALQLDATELKGLVDRLSKYK